MQIPTEKSCDSIHRGDAERAEATLYFQPLRAPRLCGEMGFRAFWIAAGVDLPLVTT